MTDGHTRRLQAILAADVVGYSRLMNRDEEGTLARLQALEGQVVDPAIAGHGGEIVKRLGDGVLAVFPSAVAALRAARAIRDQAVRFQADHHAPIVYRIGLNVGDVIEAGNDIYGDGVNIASRLEGLADPGGIALSAAVHDNVRAQDPGPFDDLGERQVKNIDHPVRVYRVRFDDSPPLPARPGRGVPWAALAAGALLLAVVLLLALQPWSEEAPPAQAAAPATAQGPAPVVAEPPAPVAASAPRSPAPSADVPAPPREAPVTPSTQPSEQVPSEAPFSERLFDSIAEAVEQELAAEEGTVTGAPGRGKVPPGQAKKAKKK